jgi:hypothetical protein
VSDGPETYSDPSFGRRIAEYTEACKKKYGEDYNLSEHDIDTNIVTALGGGKKHGRLWISDGIIGSSSLRLADVRARRTESNPQIRAWSSVGMGRLNALEVCTSHVILMFKHILRFALLKHLSQMLQVELVEERALRQQLADQLSSTGAGSAAGVFPVAAGNAE